MQRYILSAMSLFSSAGLGKKHTIAVCDVGSGSVAVGIVEVTAGEKPGARVIIAERRSLPLTEAPVSGTVPGAVQSPDRIGTLAQETATAVLEKHAKAGGTPPKEVIAIVHAPWVRSQTVHASKKYESPIVITQAVISEIAKEASQSQTTLEAGNIFERSVMHIMLNGYHSKVPEGKSVQRLGVSVLQSDMDSGMRQALDRAFGAAFPGRAVQYHSVFFAMSVVIQEYAHNPPSYTVVDVTSLATSAADVRAGAVMHHASCDVGWRTIAEGLSTIQKTTPEEALSKVRMVAEDTCSDALCGEVFTALKKVEPSIVEAYGRMFAELSKERRVPEILFVISPPDLSQWFTALLARIDLAQFTLTERPFTVQPLHARYLSEAVSFNPGIIPEAGLAVGAAFVHIQARSVH